MICVAPSILSADFAALGRDIDRVAPEADWLHVDVMDGHFVANLTIGPPVVAAIARHCDLYLDCHLMMTNPGDHLEAFRAAGAAHCSVHVELDDTARLVAEMRRLELGAGLAVNPETPYEAVEPWLSQVDVLLVMSVHPGFGGQAFMPEVLDKVRRARRAIDEHGWRCRIEVDGGIDPGTVATVTAAGAEILVAGSAIFGHDDPAAAAGELRRAATAGVTSAVRAR